MNELFKQYAFRFVGIPYIYGGNGAFGIDCSGFAQEMLKAFGAHPNPSKDLTAQGLYDYFSKNGQYNNTGVGALAFYGKDYSKITHVAVIIGPNSVIEAGGGDSTTLTVEDAIKRNAFVRIRPLKARSDLFCCVLPKYP